MQSWLFDLLGVVISILGGLIIAMYNAKKEGTRSKDEAERIDYATLLQEFPHYMQMTHDLQDEVNALNQKVNNMSNLISKWNDWFDNLSDGWDTIRLNRNPPEIEDWMEHE